jgi:hypothetical protein
MLDLSSGNPMEPPKFKRSPSACADNCAQRYAEGMTKSTVILEHAWILIDCVLPVGVPESFRRIW